jgi:hypothetical protein
MSRNPHPFVLDKFFVSSTIDLGSALLDSRQVLFITHTSCIDGVGCEIVMKEIITSFPNVKLTTVRTAYGEVQNKAIRAALTENAFDAVILADMSIKDSAVALEALFGIKYFFIFDHHPNERLSVKFEGRPRLQHGGNDLAVSHYNVVLQNNASGAMLLFIQARIEGLLSEEQVKKLDELLCIVTDYDTHTHSIPDIKVKMGILAHERFELNASSAWMCELGKILMYGKDAPADSTYSARYQRLMDEYDERLKKTTQHCIDVFSTAKLVTLINEVDGLPLGRVYVVNGQYENRSLYFEHLVRLSNLPKHTEAYTVVIIDTDGGSISLRSIKDDNAGKIARKYGGGGHGNASGIPAENVSMFLADLTKRDHKEIHISNEKIK